MLGIAPIIATDDALAAYPNPNWPNIKLIGSPGPDDWLTLGEDFREQTWLRDADMRVVNAQTVRACADFFLIDSSLRLVLHIRREPGSGDPFPAAADAVINGALWPSGGMLVKPTGDLDGRLSLAATILVKARRELRKYLEDPGQVLGLYSAGVGFTTFHAQSKYLLANGRTRNVTLNAGKASVTLNTTHYLQVEASVIDRIQSDSEAKIEVGDLASHVIVTPENWAQLRGVCLPYVQAFVDNFFIGAVSFASNFAAGTVAARLKH